MSNVDVIGNVYTQQQMHDLFSRVQCMVYPSRGEGFGLIPFEAMASGLPTIVPAHGGTSDFASLSPLQLHNDVWVPSHQKIHPGLWMDHDVDEVIELMERAIEKYEGISEMAYENAKKLHQEWSWERVAVLIKDRLDALT
jgi:glycosyltransferase involved in cell wall biosynthesis